MGEEEDVVIIEMYVEIFMDVMLHHLLVMEVAAAAVREEWQIRKGMMIVIVPNPFPVGVIPLGATPLLVHGPGLDHVREALGVTHLDHPGAIPVPSRVVTPVHHRGIVPIMAAVATTKTRDNVVAAGVAVVVAEEEEDPVRIPPHQPTNNNSPW